MQLDLLSNRVQQRIHDGYRRYLRPSEHFQLELSLKSLIVFIRHWRAMKRVAMETQKSDKNKNKRAEVLDENRV